jgi:hypothetical protein
LILLVIVIVKKGGVWKSKWGRKIIRVWNIR